MPRTPIQRISKDVYTFSLSGAKPSEEFPENLREAFVIIVQMLRTLTDETNEPAAALTPKLVVSLGDCAYCDVCGL